MILTLLILASLLRNLASHYGSGKRSRPKSIGKRPQSIYKKSRKSLREFHPYWDFFVFMLVLVFDGELHEDLSPGSAVIIHTTCILLLVENDEIIEPQRGSPKVLITSQVLDILLHFCLMCIAVVNFPCQLG